MKKGLAITLLILGGIAVYLAISVATFWAMIYLGPPALAAAVIVTAGATFGISVLRGVFAKRFELSSKKFLLCAYVPSAIASALFFLIGVCIVRLFAEYGFAFAVIWMLVSAAAIVLGTVILAVSAAIRAKKGA